MKHQFRKEEELHSKAESQLEQTAKSLEFETVEELLRYDAETTTPPAGIKARLVDSLKLQQEKLPWWKRLGARRQ